MLWDGRLGDNMGGEKLQERLKEEITFLLTI